MKPSVIVWDLETVPDLGGFAAANDLVGAFVAKPDISQRLVMAIVGGHYKESDPDAACTKKYCGVVGRVSSRRNEERAAMVA
jgi:hypothetical protein